MFRPGFLFKEHGIEPGPTLGGFLTFKTESTGYIPIFPLGIYNIEYFDWSNAIDKCNGQKYVGRDTEMRACYIITMTLLNILSDVTGKDDIHTQCC